MQRHELPREPPLAPQLPRKLAPVQETARPQGLPLGAKAKGEGGARLHHVENCALNVFDTQHGDVWAAISTYLTKTLTKESDMVDAISGVLGNNFGGIRLWGIPFAQYEEDYQMGFMVNLLWARRDTGEAGQAPLQRRHEFPSWSWAEWKNWGSKPHVHPVFAAEVVQGQQPISKRVRSPDRKQPYGLGRRTKRPTRCASICTGSDDFGTWVASRHDKKHVNLSTAVGTAPVLHVTGNLIPVTWLGLAGKESSDYTANEFDMATAHFPKHLQKERVMALPLFNKRHKSSEQITTLVRDQPPVFEEWFESSVHCLLVAPRRPCQTDGNIGHEIYERIGVPCHEFRSMAGFWPDDSNILTIQLQ